MNCGTNNKGWICPRCGVVHAPWVQSCENCITKPVNPLPQIPPIWPGPPHPYPTFPKPFPDWTDQLTWCATITR